MLNRLAAAQPGKTATNLRIQPELNLDYPDADIAEISHDDEQGFQITTTFFGLYGVSSPLPGFYTEELLDDEWDELHNRKDLFDVIHHQVYPLLYQAWLKYKFAHNTVESDKRKYWEIIFDLAGLGDSYRQDRSRYAGLARFAGLLGQRNKSLLGLKTLLREQLGDIAVDIQPCVLRKVGIARHQRCLLGKQNSRLGEDACIGKEVDDRNGKFRVEIGPLNASEFARFTTRTQLLSDIRDLIRLYLVQPLAVHPVAIAGAAGPRPRSAWGRRKVRCLAVTAG